MAEKKLTKKQKDEFESLGYSKGKLSAKAKASYKETMRKNDWYRKAEKKNGKK